MIRSGQRPISPPSRSAGRLWWTPGPPYVRLPAVSDPPVFLGVEKKEGREEGAVGLERRTSAV